MAVPVGWDTKTQRCGNHRPYHSKADAQARIGWHLRCRKCLAGGVMHAFLCEPKRQHWHIGHRFP